MWWCSRFRPILSVQTCLVVPRLHALLRYFATRKQWQLIQKSNFRENELLGLYCFEGEFKFLSMYTFWPKQMDVYVGNSDNSFVMNKLLFLKIFTQLLRFSLALPTHTYHSA